MFEKKRRSTIPDNYWDDEIPWEEMTLRQKLKSLTYMRTALLLLTVSVFFFAVGIAISVIMGGQGAAFIGIFGIISFFVAIAGVCVTLYGHFVVQIEGRFSWLVGLLPNAGMALFMLILYVSGASA